MLLRSLLLFFFLLFVATCAETQYKIVQTTFGKIRGKEIESNDGQWGFIFTGIPMAKPPIDSLRFKEAIDPDPWTEVLDTFEYRNACLSDARKTYKTFEGPVSEDCLYINVFASRTCLNFGGCAVLAYIHGGARNFESPVVFKPEVIVNNFANQERNIVLVTIPYRTGTLGWFNPAPGLKTSAHTNIGLRDCYFGLEWIQREIKNFGGDPKRVTLMGHSAGGSQIQEMVISPRSKGLYQQFICMSGLGYGGDRSHIVNSKYSQKFSRKVGCATSFDKFDAVHRVEQILSCLRKVPANKILKTQISFSEEIEEPYGTWIDGPNGVFPDYMMKLLKEPPQFNCLMGTVTAEIRDTRHVIEPNGTVHLDKLEWICSHIAYERNYSNPEEFQKVCVKYYSHPENTAQLDDDLLFYNHHGLIANAFSEKSTCYMYSYSYNKTGPAYQKWYKQHFSPAHSEDFIYIFGLHRNFSAFSEKDKKIERIYSGILANFINSGDPTWEEQKWEPWSKERRNYFNIDFDDNVKMPGQKEGYYQGAYEFWEKTARNAGGEWNPLTDFPPESDFYQTSEINNARFGVERQMTRFIDKSLNASVLILNMWEKHLVHLKTKYAAKRGLIFPRKSNLTIGVTQPSSEGINWLTTSLAIAVVVLVGYIVLVKYHEWKRRRNYHLILQ